MRTSSLIWNCWAVRATCALKNTCCPCKAAAWRCPCGWPPTTGAIPGNVTDKAVSKWERGVGFPDIKLLEPLADVLDISLLELMKSERLPKTTVSAPDTTDAFQNVIDLASYERKIERQRIALVTLFIVLLIALIFLVDIMQSFGFLFVCLPIILFFLGIWFLRLSHKKSTHKHAFLFAGLLAFAYPLCLILLFCFAFALGGPVPN